MAQWCVKLFRLYTCLLVLVVFLITDFHLGADLDSFFVVGRAVVRIAVAAAIAAACGQVAQIHWWLFSVNPATALAAIPCLATTTI